MRASVSIAIITWLLVAGAAAQAPTPPIWQGVYTSAQAERGKTVYLSACIR
jgi:hypothetical protein